MFPNLLKGVIKSIHNLSKFAEVVVGLHVVADGLNRENNFRSNLKETIQNSGNAEIGRCWAPNGTYIIK